MRRNERLDHVYRGRLADQLDRGAAELGGWWGGVNVAQINRFGDCMNPTVLTVEARNHANAGLSAQLRAEETSKAHFTDYYVRCRRCVACRKAHAAWWFHRTNRELEASPRAWFGTLTLNPEAHAIMRARAMKRLRLDAVGWDTLDPDRQFAERHKEIGRELSKWLKRVRAQAGYEAGRKTVPLRYCLVAEKHKSGLPHYHVVICESEVKVPHRILREQWKLGFVKFTVVKEPSRAAHYVSKYLSKCAEARVRASLHFGYKSETITSSDIEPKKSQKDFEVTCKTSGQTTTTHNDDKGGDCDCTGSCEGISNEGLPKQPKSERGGGARLSGADAEGSERHDGGQRPPTGQQQPEAGSQPASGCENARDESRSRAGRHQGSGADPSTAPKPSHAEGARRGCDGVQRPAPAGRESAGTDEDQAQRHSRELPT